LSGTVVSSRYCGVMCQKTNCNIHFLENLRSHTVLRFVKGMFIWIFRADFCLEKRVPLIHYGDFDCVKLCSFTTE
jgi:hypothetical protein